MLPVRWGHVCLRESQIHPFHGTQHRVLWMYAAEADSHGGHSAGGGTGTGTVGCEIMEGFHGERAFLAEGLACEQAE